MYSMTVKKAAQGTYFITTAGLLIADMIFPTTEYWTIFLGPVHQDPIITTFQKRFAQIYSFNTKEYERGRKFLRKAMAVDCFNPFFTKTDLVLPVPGGP